MEASLWSLFLLSGFFVKLIVVLLFAMSILSWTIIIQKAIQLKNIKIEIHSLTRIIDKSNSFIYLSRMFNEIRGDPDVNPNDKKFYLIYRIGAILEDATNNIAKIQTQHNQAPQNQYQNHQGQQNNQYDQYNQYNQPNQANYYENAQQQYVQRRSDKETTKYDAINIIFDIMESNIYTLFSKRVSPIHKNLGILPIISSSTPFIGLLGTVWGIMGSFRSMSDASGISSIAPGIAESLIAIAVGLIAAIPSNMAHTFFISRLEEIESEYELSICKMITLMKSKYL